MKGLKITRFCIIILKLILKPKKELYRKRILSASGKVYTNGINYLAMHKTRKRHATFVLRLKKPDNSGNF